MTVDLSKVNVGDTVHFECGHKAVVEKVTRNAPFSFNLVFEGFTGGISFVRTGHAFSKNTTTPFDIVGITPAPKAFDWSTVKPGMAFIDKEIFNGSPIVYVADHISDKDYAVLVFGESDQSTLLYDAFVSKKTELTRAPEHDVEVG